MNRKVLRLAWGEKHGGLVNGVPQLVRDYL